MCVSHSVMSDSVTPWTIACQAPLSMEFYRQEYCNGLPIPSPGDLPHERIEPGSPALQGDSLPTKLSGKPSCDEQSLFSHCGAQASQCSGFCCCSMLTLGYTGFICCKCTSLVNLWNVGSFCTMDLIHVSHMGR